MQFAEAIAAGLTVALRRIKSRGNRTHDFRGLRSECEQEIQRHQELMNTRWNIRGLKNDCPCIFQRFCAECAKHVGKQRPRISGPLAQAFGGFLLSRFVPPHNQTAQQESGRSRSTSRHRCAVLWLVNSQVTKQIPRSSERGYGKFLVLLRAAYEFSSMSNAASAKSSTGFRGNLFRLQLSFIGGNNLIKLQTFCRRHDRSRGFGPFYGRIKISIF